MKVRLIRRDELGDEQVVETFTLGEDLDADYLEVWKDMKIAKAQERWPEAQGFYFEDLDQLQRRVTAAVHEFFGDCDQEEDEEWEDADPDEYAGNMPCDTYGMSACSRSCPNYFKCNA